MIVVPWALMLLAVAFLVRKFLWGVCPWRWTAPGPVRPAHHL